MLSFTSSHYTSGIYAGGYIVYVFPFLCSFIRTSVTFVEFASKFCVKVSQLVYISATTYQKAFIFGPYMEGWHSLHESIPQGPCRVGLEVKILTIAKKKQLFYSFSAAFKASQKLHKSWRYWHLRISCRKASFSAELKKSWL